MTRATTPETPFAIDPAGVRGAQVLMSCATLEPTLSFFTGRLGFRLDAIYPADDPATAEISGHGLNVRLMRGAAGGATVVYLLCDDPMATGQGATSLRAPNGVTVELVAAHAPPTVPATQQALVVTRASGDASWKTGRAGMRYRDLLPARHGGAFIASHIRVLEGGPVPDYEHYHKVRFQMIFCRAGWVRVLYEGQGDAILMKAGDCFLQPPMIRHRVVESSPGAEVIEIGTPAEHITIAEHELTLPSPDLPRDHDFGGQRFIYHEAAKAPWKPWRLDGFEHQDTGIGAATDGLAGVRVVRPVAGGRPIAQRHDSEFCFYFVLSGSVDVVHAGGSVHLVADDSITLPGNLSYSFDKVSTDLALLEVTLPDLVALTTPVN